MSPKTHRCSAVQIRPPRKTVSGKQVLATATAAAVPMDSPVSDRPVLARGSPALHPNTESVIEPIASATPPFPQSANLTSQTLTGVTSAISLVAMDEPSFSGAVKSPSTYRVSFGEVDQVSAVPAAADVEAQAAVPGEGNAVLTVAQPAEEKEVAPARLKGILKPEGAHPEAVHLSAVAFAAVAPNPPLKRQYHVQVRPCGLPKHHSTYPEASDCPDSVQL